MREYLQAECFRLFRKKSSYFFYGACVFLVLALFFSGAGDVSVSTGHGLDDFFIPTLALAFFISSMIVMPKSFHSIFLQEDMNKSQLGLVFGTGLSPVAFLLAKLLLYFLSLVLVYLALSPFFLAIYIYASEGLAFLSQIDYLAMLAISSMHLLTGLGIAAISMPLVYLLQSPLAFALPLLAYFRGLAAIFAFLARLNPIFHWVQDHTLLAQLDKVLAGPTLAGTVPWTEGFLENLPSYLLTLALYLVLGFGLSLWILKRKEIKIS